MEKYLKIKEDYLSSNCTLREISERYNYPRKRLSKEFKADGIILRNRYKDSKLTFHYESVTTEEQAYWLGFIFADGCVRCGLQKNGEYKYTLEIGLKEADFNHLEKFVIFIGKEYRIQHREKTKSVRVVIANKTLAHNLVNLGIVQNKTYNNSIQTVFDSTPRELHRHLIRGIFDGDGHIHKRTIGFTSYFEDVLTQLHKHLPITSSFKNYVKSSKSSVSSSRYKVEDSRTILDYLYKDCTIFLNRKYQTYKDLP